MWVLVQGAGLVVVTTGLAVLGVASTSAITRLYEFGVVVYEPSHPAGVDARLVSALGLCGPLGLSGLWYLVERRTREP